MNPQGDELLRLYDALQDAGPDEQVSAKAAFDRAIAQTLPRLGHLCDAENKLRAAVRRKWMEQQRRKPPPTIK